MKDWEFQEMKRAYEEDMKEGRDPRFFRLRWQGRRLLSLFAEAIEILPRMMPYLPLRREGEKIKCLAKLGAKEPYELYRLIEESMILLFTAHDPTWNRDDRYRVN
jgi:hypothetical protein